MTIFDVIKDIYEKGSLVESREDDIQQEKLISGFMINRFLSMNWRLIQPIAELQIYSGSLEKLEYIKLLKAVFPRQKQGWYKYIKRQNEYECKDCGCGFLAYEKGKKCPNCKGTKLKEFPTSEVIKYLAMYFKVSQREAIMYRKLLTSDQVIEILEKFGEPTEEILNKIVGKRKREEKRKASLRDW